MADPWSILGLRRFSEGEPVWLAYAATLRKAATDAQRRRARDAFEAIELGLWGRFSDAVERDLPDPPRAEAESYDGPLGHQLTTIDGLLCRQTIDDLAVRDQLIRLFDDPAMQNADCYLRVEPALADLLARHLPHSEPFVLFALDRFRHVTDQALNHPAIARLLDLADELTMIDSMETGQSELTKGWRRLAKPASAWRRWLWARDDWRGRVAALYAYAGWHKPRFRRRLDAGEWAWWREELSRERISFAMMLGWLIAAIIIGMAAYQRQMPSALVVGSGVAVFAFLLIDTVMARTLTARRVPRPFDGRSTIVIATAALLLPAFTRLLPPEPAAAALVAALALIIGWGLRLTTGLTGGTQSSAWLDSAGLPVLILLALALSLSIPWERYAMLATYAWLLHAVLPQLRRPIAMALDRMASLPWGYVLGVTGVVVAIGAPFAPQLGLNLESTRVAMLVSGFALLSLAIYPRRPFPTVAALIGCLLIGGYLYLYTERGGEYRPGPAPSAGETLLAAERGDVVDWNAFPVNGDDMLDRMERDNPDAYARLMPIIRNASCDRGRDCAAYSIDGALNGELSGLLNTMSNRHLAEWTRLEARVRETQFRQRNGACASPFPQVGKMQPVQQQREYAALVLDIVSAGPRPADERREVALPDIRTVEAALAAEREAVSALQGGPVHPGLRRGCIDQLVRARMLSRFDTDVMARIGRGGYPQEDQPKRTKAQVSSSISQ